MSIGITRPSPASAGHPQLQQVGVALLLSALFYFAAIPLIYYNIGSSSRAAADQADWHLPVIRQFIDQWPHVDLTDYASSTTPGYHLCIAAAARVVGSRLPQLRLLGSLFTFGLLATLAIAVARRARFWEALILCLPVLCSIYIFSSGAFLLPDNAGWWGVLGIMVIALRPRVDWSTYVLGAIVLAATVLMRQIHVWTAAPLLVAAWLGSDGTFAGSRRALDGADREGPLILGSSKSRTRIAAMLIAVLPALLILLWFRHLWHGALVPPNQRTYTTGGNAAAPAVILSIVAIVAVFFCGYLLRGLRKPGVVGLGALAGAIIGVLPRTTYDVEARRFSGVWNGVKYAARHVPYVMDRSPLLILMAAIGGAGVAAWLVSLPRRDRFIWAAASLAFVAAQLASANPWQRYYEPFIFIAAALSVPGISNQSREVPPRWAILGPLMLALLCAVNTVIGMK